MTGASSGARRRRLLLTVVMLSSVAVMLPAQRSLGAGRGAPIRSAVSIGQIDWPTFAFSAHRNPSNPYEDILTPTTVGSLQVAWSSDIGGDGFLQPVLSRGMLYEAFGDGTIVAMAAST